MRSEIEATFIYAVSRAMKIDDVLVILGFRGMVKIENTAMLVAPYVEYSNGLVEEYQISTSHTLALHERRGLEEFVVVGRKRDE